MNIIYHCFGGAHSSVTAAAIHLGWLATSKKPTFEELLQIPYFEVQIGADHGIFRYMGEDEKQNKVFILGRRNLKDNFEKLTYGLAKIYGRKEDFLLIDTMPYVNWKMVIGGSLSRGLEAPKLGRKIVLQGVQDSFFKYVAFVEQIKREYLNIISS
mgnify:CR=1 FL=1